MMTTDAATRAAAKQSRKAAGRTGTAASPRPAARRPAARKPEPLPARRWALDLVAVTLLLAVPIVGFAPTFDGPSYLVAALGGLVLGLGLASLGTVLRWGALALTASTIVVYFLFGGALALPHTTVAGFVPTLETLRQLAFGAVTAWKQLLTTVAPVAASDGHLLVPFLLTLVAAVLTGSLALRARQAAWALVPAAAFLIAEIALGTSKTFAPVAQGVVFGVVAVVFLAIRQAWQPKVGAVALDENQSASHSAAVRRVVTGIVVVAVAAGGGVAAGAYAAPDSPRYVLRDVVIPPFDVRQYPSPLQSYRKLIRDYTDETLFTVSGLPEGARVRLATMDSYNGTVYNVSDEGAGSSSAFSPMRDNMSADAEGTPTSLHVEVGELSGVWVPTVGAATSVTFDGERADDLRRSGFYNDSTSTGVVTSRLQEGDAYDIETLIAEQPTDRQLKDLAFAPVKVPDQKAVPQEIADIASEIVAESKTPYEQVHALATWLSEDGFFSHGLEGQVLSRAGHGAERISTFFAGDQLVGDDEQYAAAMALLAGQLGIPARVVMGWYPDEDAADGPVFEATGDNLHAWVEVAFEGVGWVQFDPTPDEDQVPNDQTTKPKADPKPQVLQPPPPPQEQVDLPPTIPDERGAEDEEALDLGYLGLILAIGGGALGILLLLLSPFIVIGAIKANRRRKRRAAERAADRISGGWDELVDRAADLGAPVRPGGTRAEDAGVLDTAFAEPRVVTLATRADHEVFGPTEPTPADIDEFWRQVDEIVGGMGKSRSFWARMKARLSLRSLLAGTRLAMPVRAPRQPKKTRTSKTRASKTTTSPAAQAPQQEQQ